ncbi:hypothetical protein WMY93_007027 [Mugilogobius chulae]|uniref:Ubiquitin specific peptidase 34 n=1 Tax=Mugilogobius chulae TaxID=88201 RepID=A0AAW0PV17_9GOBI
MCENCAELVEVLNEISDADSSEGGFQLKKEHALRVLGYISSWTQRQCLCCFKEYKHLEVFNQLVYALINLVISQISSLRDRLCSFHGPPAPKAPGWAAGGSVSPPRPSSPGEDEHVNVERDSAEEDEPGAQDKDLEKPPSHQGQERTSEAQEEELDPGQSSSKAEAGGSDADEPELFSSWSTEEREKLLLCAAKIFQIQFPLYTAYKHNTHPTIEDISAHESNILGSFCDMNDVEVPLHLLRYVCLFCGKHGLSLMKDCFEFGSPESLPFPIAHAFITIVSNIRIWLHIPAVMQHIIPFRTYVIR